MQHIDPDTEHPNDMSSDSSHDAATNRPVSEALSAAEDGALIFAKNFSDQNGRFIYAESNEEMVGLLKSLKQEKNWNHVFAWEREIRRLFEQFDFQRTAIGFFLDNSDVAISFCHGLVAEKGIVFLSADQASNRRLPSFPKTHIVLAYKDQLFTSLKEAMYDFKQTYSDKLPSIIELNPSQPVYAQHQKNMLLAQGPQEVYVFFVDESNHS